MTELREVINELKISNNSNKTPIIGEIKKLNISNEKLNMSFRRFTTTSLGIQSSQIEQTQTLNDQLLSSQNDNAEILSLQLEDIGNVFSNGLIDLKSILTETPNISKSINDELKNQTSYLQELGFRQNDYFSTMKNELSILNQQTDDDFRAEQKGSEVENNQLREIMKTNLKLGKLYEFFTGKEEKEQLLNEEAENEKRKSSGKPLSEKTFNPSRLIRGNKGILGILQDFLTTAFLGPKGKGLLTSLIPGKFTLGGFTKTFAATVGSVLFGPDLISSISKSFEEATGQEDVTAGIKSGISTFLKEADYATILGTAGIAGLIIPGMGLKGAIGLALVAGGFKAVGSAMGGDKSILDLVQGNVSKFEGLIGGGLLGAATGFGVGIKGGLATAVAGSLIGAGLGSIAGALVSKEKLNFKDIIFGALGLGAGVFGAIKVGALLGVGGGPLGILAGALIGAALGMAISSLAQDPTELQKSIDDLGKDARGAIEDKTEFEMGNISKQELIERDEARTKRIMEKAEAIREKTSANPTLKRNVEKEMVKTLQDVALETGTNVEENLGPLKEGRGSHYLKKINMVLGENLTSLNDFEKKFWMGITRGGWEIPEDKKLRIYDERYNPINGEEGPIVKEFKKGDDLDDVLMNILPQGIGEGLYNDITMLIKSNKYDKKFLNKKLLAMGDLLTPEMGPINAIINEDARFSPEGVFNRPQMQYIADLIKPKETIVKLKSENTFVKNPAIENTFRAMQTAQTENEVRKREINNAPVMAPMSQPNVIDNKSITVQENFNITEMLPAPSSHVSFKDNIRY